MRYHLPTLALSCALAATPAAAQEPAIPLGPRVLALEDARALARTNNPAAAQQASDTRMAAIGVRTAYGELLPTLNVSNTFGYTAPGQQRVGSVSLGEQPSVYSSSYSVQASYSVAAPRVLGPAVARAEVREAERRSASSAADVQSEVTRRYIGVLQARARLGQAERDILRADDYLRQGSAQAAAGMISALDLKRAEVNRSQAEIRRIQARRSVRTEMASLGRSLGVSLDTATVLTSGFELFEPRFAADDLVRRALASNPALLVAEGSVATARARTSVARAAYLPSVSLGLYLHGWIQRAGDLEMLVRQRIGTATVPAEVEAEVRERVQRENRGFPFGYNSQPLNASVTVSLPVAQGFGRGAQVQRARAAVETGEARHRTERLRVYAEVHTALANVEAGYALARAQATVREQAAEELRLAEQRMRLGVALALGVTDARTRLSQADVDEIDAVYAFHLSLAELEALVGAPLR
ncbi:MAG TPA: TolC family protein [Longimicrobium sp.]